MEIKPCPFCGNRELNFSAGNTLITCVCGAYFSGVETRTKYVLVDEEKGLYRKIEGKSAQENTIDGWNRRVNET